MIGKQGFSLFPFFVVGIVPIFANDNYTLTFVSASPLYTGINLKNEFFEFHRPHAPRLLMRRYLFWQLLHRRFLAFRIYLRVGSCLPCMGGLKEGSQYF